jgi:hypothetical protein
MSRVPAKDAAVIIGALPKTMRSRVEQATGAKVTSLPNVPDTYVVQAKPEDPRKLFNRLNDVVGDAAVVAPVLVDEEGNRLFPTGRLQVRFNKHPDDKSLSDFAERHRLELTKRNRWAPQQAEFAVRPEDSRFLPEIADEVVSDGSVANAWPDVRAAFRKGIGRKPRRRAA